MLRIPERLLAHFTLTDTLSILLGRPGHPSDVFEHLYAKEMPGLIRDIDLIARHLPNKHEALLRYSFALSLMANELVQMEQYEHVGLYFQMVSSTALVSAVSHDTSLLNVEPVTYNVEQRIGDVNIQANVPMSVDKVARVSRYFEDQGILRGLVHGHFRLLTPGSAVLLINAYEQAEVVFVGMESAERSMVYKGKDMILPEPKRQAIFRRLTPFVFMIEDEVPYTDAGYASLLERLNPDVYIGQSGNPPEVRTRMEHRARELGIRYYEVQKLPGLSTSQWQEPPQHISR